jgi:hypothetical protein
MVDTSGFYRPEVTSEMLRILTPSRPVSTYVERPLDPEERAAIERAEVGRLLEQARAQQRLQDIQTRRPGFQTLSGYGAQQVNPLSRARAAEAASNEAERRLAHPLYRRFIEGQIDRAANVQEPPVVDLARLILSDRAPAAAPAAPAQTTPAAAPPVQAPVQGEGPIGEPVGGYDRMAAQGDVAKMYEGYSLPASPAVQRAVQLARQSAGVPAPPQRPDSLAPQPPSAEAAGVARANNIRAAWDRYNESGNPADFIRASALMQASMPERQQEADGGSIKAKGAAKPDPVHKALEIIHHLLVHGR